MAVGKLWWETLYTDPEADAFGDPSSDIVELEPRLNPSSTVLDVGCGEGRNSIFLAAQGHKVFALDISLPGLLKARSKARRMDFKLLLWMQDARDIWPTALYDVVMCHGLLHFLQPSERDRLAKQLSYFVKPGGYLVVAAFTTNLPPPPDMAPWLIGLFEEGELPAIYSDWETVLHRSYIFEDEHPGGIHHRHAVERIIVRRSPAEQPRAIFGLHEKPTPER